MITHHTNYLNISGNMFQIDSRYMGRDNTHILAEDKPYLYHNRVVLNYTTGCYDDDPDEPCHYEPSDPSDINRCDTWFNCLKYWLHLGALTQIQTDINRFDNETMWLSVRSRNVYIDRIELLMTPHSVGPTSPYYRTYETLVPELVSYFIYEQDVRIRCTEGLHIETRIDYPITSDAKHVNFFFDYDYPPGLYGMIGTLTSVNDAATLRVFNNSESEAFYITQEDQCYDEETKHTSNESAFTFAIGESTASDASVPLTECYIVYNNAIPTGQPTQRPTGAPTKPPSSQPSGDPSSSPSSYPSGEPSLSPTGEPSGVPSVEPTRFPTGEPSNVPSGEPSGTPSRVPTGEPSGVPSGVPTAFPFSGPTRAPVTSFPTGEPSGEPSGSPSGSPTSYPSGEPSGSPSGMPSAWPTGEPSGVPSAIPSNVPSPVPSGEPSTDPTRAPTANPSWNPTKSPSDCPSKVPTAIPSKRPTPTPTWDTPRNCTFQFMLVDTFGDGWVDMWVNLTTTDMHPIEYEEVYSELHQPNCTYKLVTVLSLSCSIEVSMLNGMFAGNGNVDGAITPWENYWHINFKGTRYVGGPESFWKVKYGRVMAAENMVNYDTEAPVNQCHECKHPPPRKSKEMFGDDGNPHHDHHGKDDDSKGKDDDSKGKDDDRRILGGKDDDHQTNDDTSSGKDDDGTGYHVQLGGSGNRPKPKAKPKARPKPKPPYLVQIALYDDIGDGFYDDSGEFDTLYSRTDINDIELRSTFPNILAYPKYYFMTKDRKKLIKPPGTICPERPIEYCEEALPYRGKFVFRFAGFEPWKPDPNEGKDSARWRFCGMSGGINEEFEFEMRDGVCFPITNTLTDELYCELGFESAIEFAMTLNVTGEFADIELLTERDTAILEKEIAELFPSNARVVVAAVEHSSPSSFVIELKMTAIAEELGYQGSSDDQVEALMTEIPNMANKFLINDLLLSKVMDNLDGIAKSENDPLRRTEKISLLSVDLLDVHFQDPNAGGAFALPGEKANSVEIVSSYISDSSSGDVALTESVGVISLLAVISLVVVAALAITRSRSRVENLPVEQSSGILNNVTSLFQSPAKTHSLLPHESQHEVVNCDESSDDDNVAASFVKRHQKIGIGDFDKQQAVHYEDDLDIYGKYMDKKTLL